MMLNQELMETKAKYHLLIEVMKTQEPIVWNACYPDFVLGYLDKDAFVQRLKSESCTYAFTIMDDGDLFESPLLLDFQSDGQVYELFLPESLLKRLLRTELDKRITGQPHYEQTLREALDRVTANRIYREFHTKPSLFQETTKGPTVPGTTNPFWEYVI